MKIFIFIIILLLATAVVFAYGDMLLCKLRGEFSERCYYDDILVASRAARVDPLLMTAMVYSESRFRPRAVSQSGAMGLMQLMPQTAFYVASLHDIPLKDTAELFDTKKNLLLGAFYLRHLQDRFQDTKLAIAAYNGGPSAVREWLKDGASLDSDIATFEKEETRRYVENVQMVHERIVRARKAWRWLDEIL